MEKFAGVSKSDLKSASFLPGGKRSFNPTIETKTKGKTPRDTGAEKFLEQQKKRMSEKGLKYRGPNWTVDLVITRPNEDTGEKEILLIKRKGKIEHGKWALPGGFWDTDAREGHLWAKGKETAIEAALREGEEEAGIDKGQLRSFVKKIGIFGNKKRPSYRDPRDSSTAWCVSIAFAIDIPEDLARKMKPLRAGDDASEVEWFPLKKATHMPLAFDHVDIIKSAPAYEDRFKVGMERYAGIPPIGTVVYRLASEISGEQLARAMSKDYPALAEKVLGWVDDIKMGKETSGAMVEKEIMPVLLDKAAELANKASSGELEHSDISNAEKDNDFKRSIGKRRMNPDTEEAVEDVSEEAFDEIADEYDDQVRGGKDQVTSLIMALSEVFGFTLDEKEMGKIIGRKKKKTTEVKLKNPNEVRSARDAEVAFVAWLLNKDFAPRLIKWVRKRREMDKIDNRLISRYAAYKPKPVTLSKAERAEFTKKQRALQPEVPTAKAKTLPTAPKAKAPTEPKVTLPVAPEDKRKRDISEAKDPRLLKAIKKANKTREGQKLLGNRRKLLKETALNRQLFSQIVKPFNEALDGFFKEYAQTDENRERIGRALYNRVLQYTRTREGLKRPIVRGGKLPLSFGDLVVLIDPKNENPESVAKTINQKAKGRPTRQVQRPTKQAPVGPPPKEMNTVDEPVEAPGTQLDLGDAGAPGTEMGAPEGDDSLGLDVKAPPVRKEQFETAEYPPGEPSMSEIHKAEGGGTLPGEVDDEGAFPPDESAEVEPEGELEGEWYDPEAEPPAMVLPREKGPGEPKQFDVEESVVQVPGDVDWPQGESVEPEGGLGGGGPHEKEHAEIKEQREVLEKQREQEGYPVSELSELVEGKPVSQATPGPGSKTQVTPGATTTVTPPPKINKSWKPGQPTSKGPASTEEEPWDYSRLLEQLEGKTSTILTFPGRASSSRELFGLR